MHGMGEKVAPQLFVHELSREIFRVEAVDFCPLNLGFLYKRGSNSSALHVGVTGSVTKVECL
jgi:hypothetical protein